MTAKLVAFNLTALAYLVIGSVHEEIRLRRTHGEDYRAYQRSGVSFYIPLPRRSPFRRTNEAIRCQ